MTDNAKVIASYSDAALEDRKRQLQNGLAAAREHGVEAPHELVEELNAVQNEIAKRTAR
ncbi:MAG TPA: hypothetical protein V6C76_02950 [Drouetiella sp.]